MTRGELARLTAIHAETIRFYERRGLLPPPPRSAAGYRLYPPAAVEQLGLIKRLRKLGFSLPEIRQLMERSNGDSTLARELERHLRDLDTRGREVRELLLRLARG